MKIKKGDKVQVMAGKDKGVTGQVLAVYPDTNKVVVEGVNMHTKHIKPSQQNENGRIETHEAPIDASKVQYYDTKSKKAGRIKYLIEGDQKVRAVKIGDKLVKIKDSKK